MLREGEKNTNPAKKRLLQQHYHFVCILHVDIKEEINDFKKERIRETCQEKFSYASQKRSLAKVHRMASI